MRGRFAIFIFMALMLALLVALNAASYVRVESEPDAEAAPDRSTLNAGASGTRALYDFLKGEGYQVTRWREEATALRSKGGGQPQTFVVIGSLRVPFVETEAQALLKWVETGGRLVLIERMPDAQLLPLADNWHVNSEVHEYPSMDVRSEDVERLTTGVAPLAPVQPTILTRDVERIAPSRFAGRLRISPASEEEIERAEKESEKKSNGGIGPGIGTASKTKPPPDVVKDQTPTTNKVEEEPPPPIPAHQTPTPQTPNSKPSEGPAVKVATETAEPEEAAESLPSNAPVFHFADSSGALLLDYAYGKGRIIVLSDPFIVANDGLARADNLTLAINIIASAGGLIAFDEYHQGHGTAHRQLLNYFAGTPILAMCAQIALIVLAILWTRAQRFGRPLPAPHVDRRSNLEFVASMAELQQRARAYDLAIENVYSRTRRALARYGGADYASTRSVIAERVAARSGLKRDELEALMRECEDAINGEHITAKHSLALVARLRELERTLGIRMRSREIKQAESIQL